eukprot:scaffold241_cov340-Pavlova_lutheri.AAC.24
MCSQGLCFPGSRWTSGVNHRAARHLGAPGAQVSSNAPALRNFSHTCASTFARAVRLHLWRRFFVTLLPPWIAVHSIPTFDSFPIPRLCITFTHLRNAASAILVASDLPCDGGERGAPFQRRWNSSSWRTSGLDVSSISRMRSRWCDRDLEGGRNRGWREGGETLGKEAREIHPKEGRNGGEKPWTVNNIAQQTGSWKTGMEPRRDGVEQETDETNGSVGMDGCK